MTRISRRQFSLALLASQAQRLVAASGSASGSIDNTLLDGLRRHSIPCVTAAVGTADKTLYSGAFGPRDTASRVPVTIDSIFAIASMTKAITSVAAMQLVEQGKVSLDEPVSKFLPQLAKPDVLQGFDAAGKPVLRPTTKTITLRHLLTHTSGFAYPTWHEGMAKYSQIVPLPPQAVAPNVPLAFEPGTRWQYGYSVDWAGKLVETISGLTLEDYFQRNILKPLGMNDTSFLVPESKFDLLVSRWNRGADGKLVEAPRALPPAPKEFNGGGGLYSTAPDYVKFMQMILRYGRTGVRDEILKGKTVEMMMVNQIGDLTAGKLKSYSPASADVDVQPGYTEKWGLGFLINTTAYQAGRSAGSLAWAGVFNTFYWIDPARGICAAIMMQFLPFVDKEAVAMLDDFEKSVYANL